MHSNVKLRSSFPLIYSLKDPKALVAQLKLILSDPNTFTFGELIELDHIRALENLEDCKGYWTLLNIFAFGSYEDFQCMYFDIPFFKSSQHLETAQKDTLPALTKAQEVKLKQLTLTSLASKNKILPYALLLQKLDIPTIRELEDLIIETIYAGLCQGKLDQVKSEFYVDETFGRDIQQSDLDVCIQKLTQWSQQSDTIVAAIEEKMDWATKYHENTLEEKRIFEQKCENTKKKMDELTELSRRAERLA